MKHTLYRIVALLLAAALVFGVAGCAKEEPAPVPTLTYAELMATVKHTTDSPLADSINSVSTWGVADGKVWAYGRYIDPADFANRSGPRFATMQPDGTDVVFVEWALPEKTLQPGPEQCVLQSIVQIALDPDGAVYLLMSEEVIPCQPDGSYTIQDLMQPAQTALWLCSVTDQSTVSPVAQLQLPTAAVGEAAFYYSTTANTLHCGADGTFWVVLNKYDTYSADQAASMQCFLARFAPDGSCQSMLALDEIVRSFSPVTQNSMLVCNGSSPTCLLTDMWGQQPALQPLSATDLLVYGAVQPCEYDPESVIVRTPLGLAVLDLVDNTETVLLEWADYNIAERTIEYAVQLQQDTFLVIIQADSFEKYQFTTLRTGADDLLDGRESITIGVGEYWADTIKQAAESYNFSNPAVSVQVVDYADTAALEQDVLAHRAPDVLILENSMDTPNYIRKGVFADLYPYIDSDPELHREDFIPGILTACEYNGQLPTIAASYSILTAVGDSDVVGATPGWSWEQYDELAAAWPDAVPFYNCTRETILLYLLQMRGDTFIDRVSGTADLDSPAFIQLLQTTAAYPATAESSMLDPKPNLAARKSLLQVNFVGGYRNVLNQEYAFDGPVTYKGFPGDTGSVAVPGLRVAVSSGSKNPDAAWAFVRTLLLPEFQQKIAAQDSLPLRADTLQALAADAMQPTETDYHIPGYLGTDLTEDQLAYFKQALTQAQADQITALVQSVTALYQYDKSIANIVFEEAAYFYNGVRTAAEAAAIMQNRVQTYLDEQG